MNNFFLYISVKHRLYLLPYFYGNLLLPYTYRDLVVEPLPVQKLDADFLILAIFKTFIVYPYFMIVYCSLQIFKDVPAIQENSYLYFYK